MGVFLRNKTQNPMFLPYPFRGMIRGNERIPVDLTVDEAYGALGIPLNQFQNVIGIIDGADPPFNDVALGDARIGIQIGPLAGQFGYTGNLTQTVILTQNVPVKIAGITTSSIEKGFTHQANNQMTYVGARSFPIKISVALSYVKFGVDTSYRVSIAKNGMTLGATFAIRVRLVADGIAFVVLDTAPVNGDRYEVQWANTETTVNPICSDLSVLFEKL